VGIANVLFGRPLASDEDTQQRVGPAAGIPIFGLDALGSAAYGPEAALTVLLPLGAAASGQRCARTGTDEAVGPERFGHQRDDRL